MGKRAEPTDQSQGTPPKADASPCIRVRPSSHTHPNHDPPRHPQRDTSQTRCPIWVAYVRLEDPPGLSPTTTVGRYDTVEAAQVATDEVWASR